MRAVALVLATLLSGCAAKGVVPAPKLAEVAGSGPALVVCVPRDARPEPERHGRRVGTATWAFADVYEFTHERGSLITRDSGLYPSEEPRRPGTSRAAVLFAEAIAVALERTGHFATVTLGDTCDEAPAPTADGAVLWTRLDHAYGSALLIRKRWRYPIAVWGDQVWTDTTVESTAGPMVGYARANLALCTASGCAEAAEAAQVSEVPLLAQPGYATRTRINGVYGRALAELAESVALRALDASTRSP